jgi:glucosamine-6-phosphate deaminase
MRVIIQPDYATLSRWAAAYVVHSIRQFNPSKDRPFVMGLPTGSTPIGLYQNLIKLHKAKKISFAHVVTFNMDEYVGLTKEHPQSYHAFMWDNLFSHIDIPKHNVHILNGMAKDLWAECDQYEQAIKRFGGIELFVGGIGPDGHLAFNEPGSSLTSRTRVKTLTESTVLANARFFDNDLGRVPRTALTVGVGTVMDARNVMILANGSGKARAVAAGIEAGVNHMWTVSCMQMHPHAVFVCDDAATEELKVGTVNYFKSIEKDNLDPDTMLIG